MPLYKRKSVFACKAETTVGTAETLTATEGAFNVYNLSIQPTIQVEEREAQGAFNHLAGVSGARQGRATFRTDIGWDGTTTMPSWADVLFPACGWVESAQVYTPRTEAPGSNVKTLTIGQFIDGKLRSIAGAVGTFRMVLPAGRMAYIEWDFMGVWQDETDSAIISPTLPTASPLKYSSATLTYNSVSQTVEQVVIDAGNMISMREDATSASGYISAIINDRYPKITLNPEAVLVAAQDRTGLWIADTEAAFSTVLDAPSDATITVSAPKAQVTNVQQSDRNKLVVDDVELKCNKNGTSNDEELSFTFTELTP